MLTDTQASEIASRIDKSDIITYEKNTENTSEIISILSQEKLTEDDISKSMQLLREIKEEKYIDNGQLPTTEVMGLPVT